MGREGELRGSDTGTVAGRQYGRSLNGSSGVTRGGVGMGRDPQRAGGGETGGATVRVREVVTLQM